MALNTIPLPFGLRDVRITPYTDSGATTLGTGIDLPYGRTFSFTEAEDFEELRGDDMVVTVRGKGPGVDWELEAGGISLEAVAAMYGGTVNTTGTTPNQKKTLQKTTSTARPFFKVEGQAISDSGGDFHVVLDRCRATDDLEGSMEDGSFWLTGASGRALGSNISGRTGVLYEFVQNETAVAIL
jgi:hypothetical protein